VPRHASAGARTGRRTKARNTPGPTSRPGWSDGAGRVGSGAPTQAADRLIAVPLIGVLPVEQIPVMDNDMFGTGTLGADERRRVVSRSRKELPVAHPL
jgi:hypothetical protein